MCWRRLGERVVSGSTRVLCEQTGKLIGRRRRHINWPLRLPPNQMDPVQKAVLHHTLGLPTTAKRKHVSCSVCQLRFNSQVSTIPSDDESRVQRSEKRKRKTACDVSVCGEHTESCWVFFFFLTIHRKVWVLPSKRIR